MKNRPGLHLLIALIPLIVLIPTLVWSSTSLRFDHLSSSDGLSGSEVNAIFQDHRGFMWFGTQGGLNRYDGYNFLTFPHDAEDPASISDNIIEVIYEDADLNLWIGTDNGINRYDPISGQFTRYLPDPNNPHSISFPATVISITPDASGLFWIGLEGGGLNAFQSDDALKPGGLKFRHYQYDPTDDSSLSSNNVLVTYIDSAGVLWIGTSDGGLNRFDRVKKSFTHFRHDSNDRNSLPSNHVNAIYEDKSGRFWIGTTGGLSLMDRTSGTFRTYAHDPDNPHSLSDNTIHFIYEDSQTWFWIGTRAGVNLFNPESEIFTHYQNNPTNPHSLNDNETRRIFEDRTGVIWIGTSTGGLNKFDPKRQRFNHYYHNPLDDNSLSGNTVRSIFVDQDGILWIGTIGEGLNRFDRELNQFTHYRPQPGRANALNDRDISCIYEDRFGMLWVGTWDSGLNRFDRKRNRFDHFVMDNNDPSSISGNRIMSIFEDREGDLWIGTDGHGLNRFNRTDETFELFLAGARLQSNAVFEDSTGTIWLGSWDGLYRFSKTQNEGTMYFVGNHVQALTEDIYGNMWLATYGTGIYKIALSDLLSAAPGQVPYVNYGENDGLPSNMVFGVLADASGHVWLSTNKGLSRLDVRSETFKNFDMDNGLQGDDFYWGAYYKSADGELFFGGTNGFNSFFPEDVKDNPYIPPIVITDFKIGGVSRFERINALLFLDEQPHPLVLEYAENDFEFEFAALDYSKPEKNQYAYKLEGYDQDWNYQKNRRFATYTNLDGGLYTFQVRGSNNDGVWNETGTSFQVKILPPFYKTWWFYLLEFFAAIGIVVAIVAYQRARVRREMEYKRKTEELEHARSIQLSLIPKRSPQIPNIEISGQMKTAKEVGGDYYDFIPSADGTKLYITIGDVSGKGAPASMLMVELRTIFHSLTTENLSTKEILSRTNRQLYPDLAGIQNPMFITLMLMCWDQERNTMYYTGAGHERIIVFRAASKTCEIIKSGGVCLGIVDGVEYVINEDSIDLEPDDLILLYTDGVTEYQNNSNEMYGLERLVEFVERNGTQTTAELVSNLYLELDRYGNGAEQYDDVTVVAIKRLAPNVTTQ